MKKVTATIARFVMKDGTDLSKIESRIMDTIGEPVDVDLDMVYYATFLDPDTGEQRKMPAINCVNDADEVIGAVCVELLDFPEGTEVPEPREDRWPDELPPEAVHRRVDPIPAFGNDPFTQIIAPIMSLVQEQFTKSISRHDRPRRVKLISALDMSSLETAVNEFLASGPEIYHVSDRIHRSGNELVKEVSYYVDGPGGDKPVEIEVEPAKAATDEKGEVEDGRSPTK